MRKTLIIGLLAAGFSTAALAGDAADKLEKHLQETMPDVPVSSVSETPVEGIYEVVAGTEVVYMTADGDYMFQGNLLDMNARVNLTEQRRSEMRLALLEEIDESRMVVYAPEGEKRHTVTVFTDTSCPYCQKLHKEIPKLTENGVEVRYILYPRSGPGSPAYKTAEAAACADDTKAAVDQAMNGQSIDLEACEQSGIPRNRELARKMGLRGTPFIVTDSGLTIPGYRPAEELIKALDATADRS